QWLIARYDPNDPNALVLAAKGGTNSEMHNQNDVGNVIIHLNQESLVADLGRGRYNRDYFGARRYEFLVNSSLGHSVPVVNGQAQQAGREHAAVLLGREISGQLSQMCLELKAAYPDSADLTSLQRTITLYREPPTGWISLEDRVSFASRPGHFESVLMTFAPVDIGDGSVLIRGERGSLRVEYDPSVVTPRVEQIPDVDLAEGPTAVNRIVFALKAPAGEATVRLKLSPSG
ncbi:MAG TPA: heparinase II/III family protein, partial [Chloroflexota bacterium]|nr:heparinase II/III family protein [Chloroflexota bacterium]